MGVDYQQVLDDLKERRESIDVAIQAIEALVTSGLDEPVFDPRVRGRHHRSRERHNSRGRDTIANLAYRVVSQHGNPMKVGDISRVLEDMGRFRDARRATSNYATVYGCLSNDRRFIRVGEAEFDLRERAAR